MGNSLSDSRGSLRAREREDGDGVKVCSKEE